MDREAYLRPQVRLHMMLRMEPKGFLGKGTFYVVLDDLLGSIRGYG